MLASIGLKFEALFDGCSFGVPSSKQGGELIKKPWRILSSSPIFAEHIDQFKCSGGHPHDACEGSDTVLTRFYNETMCKQDIKGLLKHNEHHGICAAVSITRKAADLGQSSNESVTKAAPPLKAKALRQLKAKTKERKKHTRCLLP